MVYLEHDHLLSTHLLSTHLLWASLAIPSLAINSLAKNSLAIKLICYQLSCYHIHLLSSLIFFPASTAIDTLAIRPICYQSSVAINNFSINHHLLSNFRLALNHYFNQFFSENPQKNGKISQNLEFFSLWQTLRGH